MRRILFILSIIHYGELTYFPVSCRINIMTTNFKPYTVLELVNEIYEDNYSHLEFEENMGGDPCDCHICNTLNTIVKYWGE